MGEEKEMSEEPKKPLTTYSFDIKISRHVPQDQGFYAIYEHKEMSNGIEGLKKSIAIGFNGLSNYIEKRLTVE